MRHFLVSTLMIVLIGPMTYLAFTAFSTKANAQVGVNSVIPVDQPAAPKNAPASAAGQIPSSPSNADLSKQIQQLQQAVQALQSQPHPGRTLPNDLVAAPEDPTVINADVDSPAWAKIEEALRSESEVEAKDIPLRTVIEQLKARHKIEIQLDIEGQRDAGVEPDVHITKNLRGISLRSVLHLLLDDLQLKYVIHDEVLLITTPTKAESDEFMSTRMYPVKDLVLVRNEQGAIEADFEPLKQVLSQTIASKTWQENGGNGTLAEFQVRGRCILVVSQTQEVHEQVAALMNVLRKAGLTGGKAADNLLLPTRIGRPLAPVYMGGGMGGAGGGLMGGGSISSGTAGGTGGGGMGMF